MAKNIMFQGTGSSVGKSLITAAVGRILNDRGYRVYPFKSQNMALNSYITDEGFEMGRAQVVQAEAARVKPEVAMNPILLKPTSDIGSQVILMGKVYANLDASNYMALKQEFRPEIMKAYNKLAEKADYILIEGAGSPAEINLKQNDIVNMGMAEMVDAPVILIGDIDRGGVFASLYGTYMLLDEAEKKRVKGFIINKFRGKKEILDPGIKMLEDLIPIPCLGVIPYGSYQIDDEDSVTDRFTKKADGLIRIGVVKLPYISNFTDFTPLEMETSVSLNYITHKDDISDLDVLIIPGSKNTLKDMQYVHESGLDQKIYRFARDKKRIIGICGGFQILGEKIEDNQNVESKIDSINGLGLLKTRTHMKPLKTTRNLIGTLLEDGIMSLAGTKVSGYEIHMGETEILGEEKAFAKLSDGRDDGAISVDGKIIGTYLHGIFENDEFRKILLRELLSEKKLSCEMESLSYSEMKDREYDKLAESVANSLDIDRLIAIMETRDDY
ncbi:MAG: cobyric acid synthase [Tissierellales bacterium]|jgi:adenosylcobyric acid synthase|nr:cobyric acid synthase [Tissierellales bacterium]